MATFAARVARRCAGIGVGIAVHEPPIVLPGWPLALTWHRRADAYPATAWLRDVIAEVAAAV